MTDRKNVIESYKDEANKLRWKLNQLEINSIEQKAHDEVHNWRQKFDTSSSTHMERLLNEMEKRKESEVSGLAQELRVLLEQFKETNFIRLDKLDEFISKITIDDDIQLDYVKFELDTVTKKLNSLQMDIIVKTVDVSKRRRSSTALARNSLELSKVFETQAPRATSTSSSTTTTTTTAANSNSSNFLDPLKNFVRRASTAGASYYNLGVLEHRRR